MADQKDITGQRFGMLTALFYDRVRHDWVCACDCGARTFRRITALERGSKSASCGCYKPTPNKTHGRTQTTEYRSWRAMKRRCMNPRASQYAYYGGRGITVCERWRASFENFFADMGEKPTPGHSLERVDNDGNYEPSNCRWADRSDQVTNRRQNKSRTAHCVVCGKEFQTRSGKALYCSVAHSSEHHRKLRRARTLPH